MSFTRFGLSWPARIQEADTDSAPAALALSWRVMLAVLSGLMLCAPWLQPAMFWTAWIGWVPLLFALSGASYSRSLLLGWVAGTVCFAGASHWMIDFAVNLKGVSWPMGALLAVFFWSYVGGATALGCVLYRWLSERLPGLDVLSFPCAILAVLSAYPLLFQTHFAEAQVFFLPGIQAVDLVGAQGMDFIMLVASALAFELLRRSGRRWLSVAAGLALALWFGYGWVSLNSWDERVADWETRRIGLVQPNDAVSLDLPPPAPGFSREEPEEMVATRRLAKLGAQWIAWPEARYKGYFDMYSVRRGYAEEMSGLGVPLIFHDVERRWEETGRVSYNSVALLDTHGELAGTYRKMQRMPFGEYLPAFFHLPGLKALSDLFLGEFLQPLTPGAEHAYFQIADMQVVPKVCYETAFPAFIAEAVGGDAAGRVLLFLSQDGWFGETSQPFQHKAMSIVRGVENRVPMVHLINNGPSVATTPSGRTVAQTQAFSRAQLLVDLPFSATSGGSFYSRHPHLAALLMYCLLAGLVGLALWHPSRRSSQTTSPAQ
ncbi:Apolipoprotein N-acyltransferase [Halopseudomonas xinjiangensis]|uniref:Apolipoprotein N-acyltransferase n=1 Tax=Halopseudomonas xinjiangensis TaxID=487184 RepID=A0A1H1L5Y5_9GAMM|nr:apolipoprotein N-acyltransferase [Halopseudomonas xinjiangensis]SDR69817.1 Apolipoprotein N-acyltransferase [Halopseudomonas xinjiangensis]